MAKKIPLLAIDDDPEFLKLISYALDVGGFEVYQALNGYDALEIANTEEISVVILDTIMPEMDGIQVLSELKHGEKTQDIPVIMLTAKSVMGDIEYAFEIGADDYITKPVEIRSLAEKIKSKLKKIQSMKVREGY